MENLLVIYGNSTYDLAMFVSVERSWMPNHHLIFDCPTIEDLRLSTTGIDLTWPFVSKESSEIFNDFVIFTHKRLVFWKANDRSG